MTTKKYYESAAKYFEVPLESEVAQMILKAQEYLKKQESK